MSQPTQLAPMAAMTRLKVHLPTGTGTWWQIDNIIFHTCWAARGYQRTPVEDRDAYLAALTEDGFSYDIDPTMKAGL